MPTTKAKGRDFSDCTFRTLVPSVPPAIQRMIERALGSFGLDSNVLPRWKEPVPQKDGSTLTERQVFPHVANDICCADGAGFILYQSGVVDLGRDRDFFKAPKGYGGCIHAAHYYWPHEGNTDVCRLVQQIPNTVDPKTIDTRDWLPGDYFLYFDKDNKERAAHINVYMGPFVETVDGKDVEGTIYEFFNSSIGITGGNEFCTAGSLRGHIAYCASVGRSIYHCRVNAIERLFRNRIAAPVQFSDAPPKPTDPPQAQVAWKLSELAEAPYPVGRNLTWHDGIHLVMGEGLKGPIVVSFAAGELTLARFGKDASPDHNCFMVLKHRLVPQQVRLLPPPPADEGKQDDPEAPNADPFYSLYAQLAPLSIYLVDGVETAPGIPELYGQRKREIPAGKSPAPPWLQRIWLRAKPDLIDQVPDDAPITLLALTRTDSDPKPKLRPIATPPGLIARHAFPLDELESVTVDGTKYWMLTMDDVHSNAQVWDGKIPPVNVPKGKKLAYFNPHTGVAFETAVTLSTKTILQHVDAEGTASLVRVTGADGAPITGDKGTLIAIEGHDHPGIDTSSLVDSPDEKKDQYDYDHEAEVLSFTANAKRITLYTQTDGQGAKRHFVRDDVVDLGKIDTQREFKVIDRLETGGRVKSFNLWLDLKAGVWMKDDEITKVEQQMAAGDVAMLDGIKARLKNKRSALVGVKLKGSGWAIEDGHLVAAADAPEEVSLYRKIIGSGPDRKFEEPPKDPNAVQEHEVTLDVPPPSGVKIVPLLKPQGRVQSAVFELIFAATKEGTNQADIDRVDQQNQERRPLVEKLLNGELVDFRKETQLAQAERNVNREPIADMGDVPGPVAGDVDKTVKGVHFEIFAGKNLVDPSVTGSDGAITPVPKSPWAVWKDSSTDGFFSKDFVNKLIELLKKEQEQHRFQLNHLDEAFGQDNVVQPEEWMAFCKQNGRPLSRLITVHQPEWKIDWAAQVKTANTRGIHTPQDHKDDLSKKSGQINWGNGVSFDDIPGDVFFYHPLRFIEWINTGVDFAISGTEKQPKVKVQPPGGDEIELTATKETPAAGEKVDQKPGLFRYRTFAGEGDKDQVPLRVVLENVDTAVPEFNVMIYRGEVRTIRLIQPRVRKEFQSLQPSIAAEYAVPVTQSGANGGAAWLLADGNAALQNCGYSITALLFTVEYNVLIPGSVTLELSGDDGFSMRADVAGATAKAPKVPTPFQKSITLSLADDFVPAKQVKDSVVRGAKAYNITLDVLAATRKCDAKATLKATFSGGDFVSPKTITVEVGTRTLAFDNAKQKPPAKEGASSLHGEDVAKLQLYLSQLFAADDAPCYRRLANGSEFTPDKTGTALTNGNYGKSTARALWRFIYAYGGDKNWKAWPIKVKNAKGEDGTAATKDQITAVPASMLEAPPPTKAVDPANGPADLFAQRVGGYAKTYDHYPVVDAALIDEIVKRFKPPFIMPHIEVFLEKFSIPSTPTGASVREDWNKDGNIGKSTVLPMADDSFTARVEWVNHEAAAASDMSITIELPADSAYKIDGAGSSNILAITLKEMLAKKFLKLNSSGAVSSDPKKNELIVRSLDGMVLGKRQLHGSRDLLKAQNGDACRDAALVQYWLATVPDLDPKATPGSSIYTNTTVITEGKGKDQVKKTLMLIDGKWNKACVDALQRFQAQYVQQSMDLPNLLASLKAEAAKHS